MRIIAGSYRSRNLVAPAGMETRPTSDRLRESLFNILAPRIEGARVADLYAGSGAIGLEALSRGAVAVEFVEKAPPALKALRANLTVLGIRSGVTVQGQSAKQWLKRPPAKGFDIVFLDPPYDAAEEYETVLTALGTNCRGFLAEGAVVIAEHRRKDKLAERYGRLERSRLREQGDASLSFYLIQAESADSKAAAEE